VSEQQIPLIIRAEGAFLRTDLKLEQFWHALGRDPKAALSALWTGTTDTLHASQPLRGDLLPVSAPLIGIAKDATSLGHVVTLASDQTHPVLRDVALANGMTVGVEVKAGERFHYAGGSDDQDRAAWADADDIVVVDGDPAEIEQLEAAGHSVTRINHGWRIADLIRALRPHQYVKNILLLLPIIAAHRFDWEALFPVILGIIAFCAAASSIYIVNDLLDLQADRLHPKKKYRPFASGAVPIKIGQRTCIGLGLFALLLAAALNPIFLGVVAIYMLTSLAYSLKLKRMRWIDIATLAGLYTLRVVAGAAAAQVYVTGYMLVYIFPVFVCLGCVKRLTELTLAVSDEKLPGRGYGRPDREDLFNVAILGMFGALLVFFLYSFTEQARGLYPTQWLLWVALIPMAGWLWRMVSLGYKGKQDYDPIVFAMKDRYGLSLIIFILTIILYAAGLFERIFG
jgi:4-hydroxybenzoate polyprenyltransferase